MILKQFNTVMPQSLEANRTQVNINILPATKQTMDGEVQGYEYDTVIVEDAFMYTDDALVTKAKIEQAQTYLASTDWYIVRFIDSGVEVPQEIKDKRAEARLIA